MFYSFGVYVSRKETVEEAFNTTGYMYSKTGGIETSELAKILKNPISKERFFTAILGGRHITAEGIDRLFDNTIFDLSESEQRSESKITPDLLDYIKQELIHYSFLRGALVKTWRVERSTEEGKENIILICSGQVGNDQIGYFQAGPAEINVNWLRENTIEDLFVDMTTFLTRTFLERLASHEILIETEGNLVV